MKKQKLFLRRPLVNRRQYLWAVDLSDMTEKVDLRFTGGDYNQNHGGSIAVSDDRIYHQTQHNFGSPKVLVFRKPAASTTSITSTSIRMADEDFAGRATAGLFYERTSNQLWSLTFTGQGNNRTWEVQAYDFASSAWTTIVNLPDRQASSYTGLVVTRDSVLMGRIANPGQIIQHNRHTGEFVRSYEIPSGLQHATGIAGDVNSARIFYRFDIDKVGYFRALTPGDHLQRHADALLARRARTVRRLTLTLKPRSNLLPLPYAGIVAVPAGAWGAAGNWHLQSWDISLDTRRGWVHKLDLTDYPRRADTRVWERLTA